MIAPEGKIILIPLLLLFIAGMLIYTVIPSTGLKWVNIVLVVLTVFSLYFFRDPERIVPNLDGFLSPADGKIVNIIDIEDDEIGKAKQISIFLSIFNVHSQRVPFSGKVISKQYNPGKFLAAFNHKASQDNEQTLVAFKAENGEIYKIKQIAGHPALQHEARVCRRLGGFRRGDDIALAQAPFGAIFQMHPGFAQDRHCAG